jgi:gluconate 5-dehydrogenase
VAFDLLHTEQLPAAVEHVRASVGRIDILVNNAGFIRRESLLDVDADVWRQTFDVNVTAAMLVSRALVPDMIEAGAGKIVNVSSVLGRVARAETGAYAATKAALTMLTQVMCAEWARHGIQANALAPGYVHTDLTKALVEDPAFDAWLKARVPAGRWGEPSDLDGAVVFLASAASAFVNGQVLAVDGGLLAVV